MTHIEQMIQDMCPNGVEFKTLGEVTYWDKRFNEVDRSLQPQIRKYHYYLANELEELESPTGTIKILYTSNRIAYADEETVAENVVDAEVVAIPWGGNANIKYFKGKFITADNRIAVVRDPSILSTKFVYYWLTKNQAEIDSYYRGAGIKHPSMLKVLSLPIPLPPIEIQKKIVECLDKFSALELQMRRKQYEYYRTQLLTPHSDCNSADNTDDCNWEWKTLGEICENCDYMRRPITATHREKGEYPYYGASGIVDYVKDYIFDGEYLLISEDGANLVARSTPIAFSIKGRNWVNNHAHVLKFEHRCTQKLVEYFINSINVEPYVSGGAQPKLNQANLNKISIPLPSLAEQARIVSILDKFEALTTSLSDGIPAEQAAQQKRYEYYRDLLLTFDRKAV